MSTNPTDYGAQKLSFDFRSEARASIFNRLFHNLLPYGLYNGGQLSRLSNVSISVDPMSVVIPSNNNDSVAVKIDTTESQVISFASSSSGECDTTRPYVILRFGWVDEEDNFMEIISSSFEAILETDIILGKVNFSTAEGKSIIDPSNPFDLSKRQTVTIANFEKIESLLKVSASEPPSNKVTITGGTIVTSKGKFVIEGKQFPEEGIEFPAASRIDLVGIDVYGNLVYVKGTESAAPKTPSYGNLKVLAELHLKEGATYISGSDIVNVQDWTITQGRIAPEDVPIVDEEEHFPETARKITAAIHYLWTHSLVLNPDGPEVDSFKINIEDDVNFPLGKLFLQE